MVAVIWIDWYAYHIARLRALTEHRSLRGKVCGIELVGGCGVHEQLRFREEQRDGLPITTLLPGANWNKSAQLKSAIALWRRLREVSPSLVLIPGYYTLPGLAAAAWARLNGRKAVLMSETTRQDHPRNWFKEMPKGLLVRSLFDAAIAGGTPHVQYLKDLGFNPKHIAHSYDVVDNDAYATATERMRKTTKPEGNGLPSKYFLYVGRLAEEKNVSGLLRSFANYVARDGQWDLIVAGDGPMRNTLEAESHKLGLAARVTYAGIKTSRELIPYYAFAGCFVLPSTREPWGLVVNEAMASGLPVIVSTRCGCSGDLVKDGENGFVFDPFREDKLTEHLSHVSSLNSAGLENMSKESKRIIARFSLETWAGEVGRLCQ